MDGGSNQTTMIMCPPSIDRYIKNLTSSYTEKSNEASMVSASVIMFVLAGLFFNLNLFSGISDVSATLDPKLRLFLSSALSLLLPVMSYLFSEAKNAAASSGRAAPAAAELSMGAGLILAWMLLVELLRKKVDEIRMRGFSGTVQRAGRVAWLGSLVFFNLRSTGRKALFAVLWILCATRVVQRIAYTEIGKNSFAHGKNARLINSYMAKKKLLEEADEDAAAGGDDVEQARPGHVDDVINGRDLLKRCSYIVMGEEKMVVQPTADGYELDLTTIAGGDGGGVITVGKVWDELDENDDIFTSPGEVQRLKRLCLSFALFKLLRRKFERLLPAVTDREAQDCRRLIFRGLLRRNAAAGEITAVAAAEEVFQVVNDEVVFLSEYYHAVVPVVLASPFFLVVNYFVVLAVVAALCVMTVVLCGNGDAAYAFTSIADDNYAFRSGIGRVAVCLLLRAKNSPAAFFSVVDLAITLLLFVIYFYEEIWEFFVFLLSNWFMVSLVGSYMARRRRWRESTWIRYAFRRIIWLRSKLNHGGGGGGLRFRQFSVLHHRWPLGLPFFSTLSLVLRTELVPRNLKQAIVERLLELDLGGGGGAPANLTNGKAALQSNLLFDRLSWACKSDSVSEVLLTWHIATCIMETQLPQGDEAAAASAAARRTAARLSKYCAYLVAFRPELLPDSPDKTERVVDDMKAELAGIFWCWEYHLLSQRAQARRIMDAAAGSDQPVNGGGVVRNGGKLGSLLVGVGVADAWKVLADVWTELIVFVAPTSDEERVKGHQDALVQGGEFITVLWALTTHIGVSSSSDSSNKLPVKTLEGLMGESMRNNAPPVAPEEISIM